MARLLVAAVLVPVVLLGAVACPSRGKDRSGEEARRELLASEAAKRYEKRLAAAAAAEGGSPIGSLEHAALGYLWLRDGNPVRATVALAAVQPRDLDKFERKLFYVVRGLAYYGAGWHDLAGREFREADLISLTVDDVNLDGGNNEPISLADLFTRAMLTVATPDEGLAAVSIEPVSEASVLVGDARILHWVEAEVAHRRGAGAEAVEPAKKLLDHVPAAARARLEKAVAAQSSGGEGDWSVLAEPQVVLAIAAPLLEPHLPVTKAAEPGRAAFARAEEIRRAMKASAK